MLSQQEREQLITEHQGLVVSVAHKVRNGQGREMDIDELVAYGNQGIWEASGRWDPSSGATFSTFAFYRIRGAMFDGLRREGWVSRDQARLRYEERFNDFVQHEQARQEPADDDPATTLGQVADLLQGAATIFITSYHSASDEKDLDATDTEAPVDDPHRLNAEQMLCRKEVRQQIRRAMDELTPAERRLMELHYFQDRSLANAGRDLGLSRSWASRLHAKVVRRLGHQLRDLGPD